jgi:hypothetical protein
MSVPRATGWTISAVLRHGDETVPLSDDLVAGGTLLSNDGNPGVFLAGFDHAALVELRVQIVPDDPAGSAWRWAVLAGALATRRSRRRSPSASWWR